MKPDYIISMIQAAIGKGCNYQAIRMLLFSDMLMSKYNGRSRSRGVESWGLSGYCRLVCICGSCGAVGKFILQKNVYYI